MALVEQGGGGGRAGGETSEEYALDKPYDMTWPPSPTNIDNLNEMLDLLFKAHTRARNEIRDIQSSTSESTTEPPIVLTAYRRITDAEIKLLLTTPITIVANAIAGTVVEVLSCYLYFSRDTAYTNNPAGSLRYSGDATDITNSGVFLQTSALPGTRMTRFSINSSNQTFDPATVANAKDVVWRAGQDNTAGASTNFLDVFVTYRIITLP